MLIVAMQGEVVKKKTRRRSKNAGWFVCLLRRLGGKKVLIISWPC